LLPGAGSGAPLSAFGAFSSSLWQVSLLRLGELPPREFPALALLLLALQNVFVERGAADHPRQERRAGVVVRRRAESRIVCRGGSVQEIDLLLRERRGYRGNAA
jgi:hypothetical protein